MTACPTSELQQEKLVPRIKFFMNVYVCHIFLRGKAHVWLSELCPGRLPIKRTFALAVIIGIKILTM